MAVQCLALSVFLVAIHSLILGIFIFLFTDLFYRLLLRSSIENFFFVRQSGLFLVCLACFYLSPLTDLTRKHRAVLLIILTKVLAVLYLVTHAHFAPWRPIIYLAALGDGLMGLLLAVCYRKAGLYSPASQEAGKRLSRKDA